MTMVRKTLLGLALIATVAASVFDFPLLQEEEPRPAQMAASVVVQAAPVAATALAPPSYPLTQSTSAQRSALREPFAAQQANLFAGRSWAPPAPPPPKQVAQEVPRAPPLPFRYLGKKIDGNEVQVFLGAGANVLLLRKGSFIASTYQVQEVSLTDMTLVYLPLNETQRLTFGSSN